MKSLVFNFVIVGMPLDKISALRLTFQMNCFVVAWGHAFLVVEVKKKTDAWLWMGIFVGSPF
jgi:hypothetical protein